MSHDSAAGLAFTKLLLPHTYTHTHVHTHTHMHTHAHVHTHTCTHTCTHTRVLAPAGGRKLEGINENCCWRSNPHCQGTKCKRDDKDPSSLCILYICVSCTIHIVRTYMHYALIEPLKISCYMTFPITDARWVRFTVKRQSANMTTSLRHYAYWHMHVCS